jgi:hypothetical protein
VSPSTSSGAVPECEFIFSFSDPCHKCVRFLPKETPDVFHQIRWRVLGSTREKPLNLIAVVTAPVRDTPDRIRLLDQRLEIRRKFWIEKGSLPRHATS